MPLISSRFVAFRAARLEQWANETHGFAATVWSLRPADNVLDDRYLRDVLPILDRQLGVAGLRLAGFLNGAVATTCTPHWIWRISLSANR